MIRYEVRDLRSRRACRVYEAICAPSYCGLITRPMWMFFRTKTRSLAATHVILAYTGRGELVGVLVYDRRQKTDRGTYVSITHRGRGIATEMWVRAMRLASAKRMTIKTVSKQGSALVRSLSRRSDGAVKELRLW
jgi:predicted GNAT family acetyltransferase